MEIAIERIVVISFLVTGLSHMLQPRLWVEFFLAIRDRGHVAGFINAFIHMPLGLLIVGFHNVWSGLPAVVTVIGWGLVFKGTINFVVPQLATRSLRLVSREHPGRFAVAGAVCVALSLTLGYGLFLR